MTSVDEVRDRDGLLAWMASSDAPPDLLLFWGHRGRSGEVGKEVLSQWWPVRFEVDGVGYASAEQWMMAGKARLFGDDAMLARILATDDPSTAKRLGRKVRGFEQARWAAHGFELVVEGNVAKFGQHPALAAYLASTRGRVLVEASPTDRIWGIGLAAADPRASDPAQWQGSNLLGFALMEARQRLAPG